MEQTKNDHMNWLKQKQSIGDIIIAFYRRDPMLGVIRGFTPTNLEQIFHIHIPTWGTYKDKLIAKPAVVSSNTQTMVINDATLFELFDKDGLAQKAKEVQYQIKNGTYKSDF